MGRPLIRPASVGRIEPVDRRSGSGGSGGEGARSGRRSRDGMRETVESIVVAFVMAFLFRTFEVEAFVIPTGSMAPTLMGRHKELVCPTCGYAFTVGMPSEEGHQPESDPPQALCPNCQYGLSSALVQAEPSYWGDRILVLKFPYEFSRPRRWDVIVFRYPEDTTKNYIKRLVGLPGEVLTLRGGDVYTRVGEEPFRIQRKSLSKIRALRQIVFDNNHQPQDLAWQARWVPVSEAWKPEAGGRQFECRALEPPVGACRLEYRHWMRGMASADDWRGGVGVPAGEHSIRDFCAYNSREGVFGVEPETRRYGFVYDQGMVVDDLMLVFDVTPVQKTGELAVELVEPRDGGGRVTFRASLDLAADRVTVTRDGRTLAVAGCPPLKAGQAHRVEMANFDSRLNLVVDGTDVLEGGLDYDPEWEARQAIREGPSRPVALVAGRTHVRVANLVLYRDVYYRAEGQTEFRMGPDDYFVLGDNSPRSQDSRLWTDGPCVPGRHLIGQAFVIYWPHGLGPPLPILDFRVIPNIPRMGLIR